MIKYKYKIPLYKGGIMAKKQLKELTIKDNFMFGAVMCDENNCKDLLI